MVDASEGNASVEKRLNQKLFKSSHQRCSFKKGVAKIFAKPTAKYLYWSLLFNKVY